jgi:DNA-directed RNA polymerase subunit RPC12/RpoP
MSQGQRNGMLVVVAVAALVGAGWLFFRGSSAGELPKSQGIYGICVSCKHEAESAHPLGAREPFECEKCKTRSVYAMYFCNECQKRFVPQLRREVPGEPMRVPMPVHCPVCNTSSVSIFFPGYIDQADIKGDHALPKWEP